MTVEVLYIGGDARSGSTLLGRYLESVAPAVHVGELRYLWQRGVIENQLCECGEPFNECPFWLEVFDRGYHQRPKAMAHAVMQAKSPVDNIARIPRMRSKGMRVELKAFYDAIAPLYVGLEQTLGGRAIIDSSKDPAYLFALRSSDTVKAQVLHLVRDSRAVAHSWSRRRRRPEIHWREEYMEMHPSWRAALLWNLHNGLVSVFQTGYGAGLGRLRYEDFVSGPEQYTVSARSWLERSGRSVDDSDTRGHSFSGNPMRFGNEPLKFRLDDEWRTGISRRNFGTVTALTAPLLGAYGYRLAR